MNPAKSEIDPHHRAKSGTVCINTAEDGNWKDHNIKITPCKISRKSSICEFEECK